MDIISEKEEHGRLIDGINTVLNLNGADFEELIQQLAPVIDKNKSIKLENMRFWYLTDPCEVPSNPIQLGLASNFDNGKRIGRYYFGGERYNINRIFKEISEMKKKFLEGTPEREKIESLLSVRNLDAFKSCIQEKYDVSDKFADRVFEILKNKELFEKFLNFDENSEGFNIDGEGFDKRLCLMLIGKIFGMPNKDNKVNTSISSDFYIPDFDVLESRYLTILQKYNLERYTNRKFEFKGGPITGNASEEILRKGDEPDWEVSAELKNEAFSEMPDDLSLEEKAMYIYLKLCKVLKYDQGYFFRNKKGNTVEYESDFSKENLEGIIPGSPITCFDFSRIFSKLVNGIEGDIEAVVISTGINKGHFFTGFYTDRVSTTLEAINNGTDGLNDLMKVKNGIRISGIKVVSDKEGVLKSSLEKVYPLVYGKEQMRINDYISQLKEIPKENTPNNLELKFQSFVEMISEKGITGNEAIQTLLTFGKAGFWENGLEKAFIGEKYTQNGKQGYKRFMLVREKDNDDVIYVFDTETLTLEKSTKEEIVGKFKDQEYVYEDDKHKMAGIGDDGR